MVILTFGIAWLLLFRSEWLADRLKIPAADSQSSPSLETLLFAGTKLIGLLIVVQGIPLLVQGLPEARCCMHIGAYMWSMIAGPLVRIAIGVFLVLKTRAIVNFIIGKEGRNKPSEATLCR